MSPSSDGKSRDAEILKTDIGGQSERGPVIELVIFSVGYRSAVSISCEENFILAKNLHPDRTKPGSSLISLEGLLGRSPPGEAFWRSAAVGGRPASGAQIGFGVIGLFSARWPGVPPWRTSLPPPLCPVAAGILPRGVAVRRHSSAGPGGSLTSPAPGPSCPARSGRAGVVRIGRGPAIHATA